MIDPAKLKGAVDRACDGISPCWPLDRFIAVNPFWARTDKPLPVVAGELAALSGAKLLMPRSWYAAEYREKRLLPEHLKEAIAESGQRMSEAHLSGLLRIEEPVLRRRPLVVDVMDQRARSDLETSWREFIVERISRFCASYFDDNQAFVKQESEEGLYVSWREQAMADRGPALFMNLREYRNAATALPATAAEMMTLAAAELGVPADEYGLYLSALLLDINGWASWCAYLRWQSRLENGDDHHIYELLAIRAAWEWILFKAGGEDLRIDWGHAVASWPTFDRVAQQARAEDWLLQNAVEIAWMSAVRRSFPDSFEAKRPSSPRLQAVFCLDVRSEVYRRALEEQGDDIQTLGAAGFFGMPIEYSPLAADSARPQLPGLLAPKYRVTDTGVPESLETKRASRLNAARAWKAFKSSSLSSFAFVDAMGIFFGANLFKETFEWEGRSNADDHERAGLSDGESKARLPRITSRVDGTPITSQERCDLALAVLRSMGLTRDFAPYVLLLGHKGETRNNPHAAGLDCGACCGQSGEVNARTAAALLNDEEVRASLSARGIDIAPGTQFVPGVHNTTTDDIILFDTPNDLAEIRAILERASTICRRHRAPKLGLDKLTDAKLHEAVLERAKNWAEVRPEWGLVGNASFIIAPRERTRHIDLGGRAFLHDYRFEDDPDFGVLEQIIAGPMVVAHWINFQYYMSTVDNTRYGTGNKVLHNVVGGHIGVYEGNGGDLRIGLSLQSLHDGERWVHQPLRLSVFIEAPRDQIDRILQKHAKVAEIVENEWVHLFQIDVPERAIHVRRKGKWQLAPP